MIKKNVQSLRHDLPDHVSLEAAAKTRSLDAVAEAIEAGVNMIGENYVQEMIPVYQAFSGRVPIHFIGHLQTNKVKTAVQHCDMIETVDSLKLAREIDKRAAQAGKVMPVLIEINSGREPQKHGVMPEAADALLRDISNFEHLSIQGLMTMGPSARQTVMYRAFETTRDLFHQFQTLNRPRITMKWLSMGMSHSYPLAIQCGANIIRIGTQIFGARI